MALIILGHPDWEKSLANKEIVNGLVNSEANVEVRNLQQLYPDFKIDIKKEQEALLRHKNIVFQFPLLVYYAGDSETMVRFGVGIWICLWFNR